MKAIQKTNKHMMEEIGKTSQKRDREGPRGPKVIFFLLSVTKILSPVSS